VIAGRGGEVHGKLGTSQQPRGQRAELAASCPPALADVIGSIRERGGRSDHRARPGSPVARIG
jgi:hypothetical protein